jgi:hypothetical protein
MSVILTHREISAQRLHWLADDAVGFEPVFDANFRITGKNTGKIAKSSLK